MNYIAKIKKLLTPYEFLNLKRYGGNYDGGYILSEELLHNSNIIYSYGVGPDESWITFDREMVNMNKNVYLYDKLKNDFWDKNHPLFNFNREYVNSKNIYSHILYNQHINYTNMILKMDIEGNEFETLLNCDEKIFYHFNQLAIEVHDVVNSHTEPQFLIHADNADKRWMNKINLFNKLNKFYYLVHIHGNNNSSSIREGLPDVLELLYIRKDKLDNAKIKQTTCPIFGLDYPNNPSASDIRLDWWLYD
jgi:hypothetical protein